MTTPSALGNDNDTPNASYSLVLLHCSPKFVLTSLIIFTRSYQVYHRYIAQNRYHGRSHYEVAEKGDPVLA
jgi:hypothetical protein